MQPIAKPAVWAAAIGPVQSALGWLIAGSMWEGYDPVRQTISDLAAPGSPVSAIMSSFFILGGTLTLVAAIYARTFAPAGRVALFLAAICTYGLTIFPTPLVGYSTMHRIFAIGSFVLSACWPLLAMRFRKDAPWVMRPIPAISATGLQAALAIVFLIIWTDPSAPNVGVWERVVALSQACYISAAVFYCYWAQRRNTVNLS